MWCLIDPFLAADLFNDAEEFDSWYNVQEGKSEEGVINQIHRSTPAGSGKPQSCSLH